MLVEHLYEHRGEKSELMLYANSHHKNLGTHTARGLSVLMSYMLLPASPQIGPLFYGL